MRGCNAVNAALTPINFEKLRRERVGVFIAAPPTEFGLSYKPFAHSGQGLRTGSKNFRGFCVICGLCFAADRVEPVFRSYQQTLADQSRRCLGKVIQLIHVR